MNGVSMRVSTTRTVPALADVPLTRLWTGLLFLLVQVVMLNWMAANGTLGNFDTIFPMQGLGAATARTPYVAFNQIT